MTTDIAILSLMDEEPVALKFSAWPVVTFLPPDRALISIFTTC
ncbi:hypothetical protein ABZ942_15630 [Nocardia sp. NPDC046473]